MMRGNAARRMIVDAANNYLARSQSFRQLAMRHVQEAVCICRRRLLVSDETLRAAGYNGVTVAPARRTEPWGGRSSYAPKKVRR
jgi:hypothetical protein